MDCPARLVFSAVLALALATLILLAAVSCFPGTPTAIPEPVEAPVQSTGAATALITDKPLPTATPVPPPPTSSPTAEPAVTPQLEEAPEAAGSAAITEAQPAPGSPVFDDLALLEERALSYLTEMAVDVGVRTSGTALEAEAADFLMGRMEELGYSPETQEFSWDSPTAGFSIVGVEPEPLDANTLGGTPDGEATAELVFVGLARPSDMPAEGLEGRIALIERGEITFGRKVAEVKNAGALAAVIYNNVSGPFRGTLGGRADIPAISLSQADGRRLKELLDQGETVEATVTVQENAVPSRNVIADLPGTDEGVVVVGAHYDTVPDSIGASDNSSGMGALLAIAERVADRSFPFTLRFIAFGSEETGLHGSEHYVASLTADELEEIYLMVNLDSVGSGSRLRLAGDRWAANHVKETADREDIPLELSRQSGRGGSDHANFRDAWVPVLFFLSNDLSRINSPQDTMEHINSSLLGDVTALVLDLLENVDELSGYGP